MRVVNIIPTYNEAENIGKMIRGLQKYKYPILIVDDMSPDGTGEIAKKYKGVEVLEGEKEGLGVAMVRGIRYAMEKMKAEIIVTWEADMAYDPNLLPKLLEKIKDYDVVVGTRTKTVGWNWHRHLNHWVANVFFATWVAGVGRVHDHNGALRVVRARVLKGIDWDDMPKGFGFFNYWLFEMLKVTDKVSEMPVTYRFRTAGESKVSFNPKYIKTYLRDVGEYIWLCLKIRLEMN